MYHAMKSTKKKNAENYSNREYIFLLIFKRHINALQLKVIEMLKGKECSSKYKKKVFAN